MKSTNEDFLNTLVIQADVLWIKNKCVEELSELATVITQTITKPGAVNETAILTEIADVEIMLRLIKEKLSINLTHLDNYKDHKISKMMESKEKYENFGRVWI